MTRPPRLFVVSSRGKATSAGGVVLDRKGRVALIRQRSRSGKLRWTLPKGRLDPGETLEEAAVREVLEETGVRARIVGYVGVHEGKRSFVHYFQMTMVRREAAPDPAETLAVRWVSRARAKELCRSPRDRAVLATSAPVRRAHPRRLRRD